MKIDPRPTPERELSLIERAQAMYGFGDGLLAPDAPVRAAPVQTTVRPEPVEGHAATSAPLGESRTSTSSVRTGMNGSPAAKTVRPDPVEARGAASDPIEDGRTSTSSVRTGFEQRVVSEPGPVRLSGMSGVDTSVHAQSVRAEPVEALPFSSVEVEKKGSPLRPAGEAGRSGQASKDLGRTEDGFASIQADDSLDFLATDAPLAAEEPLELDTPALPEWAAPTGIARIDRVMLAEKGMLVPGAPIGALAEEFRLVKRQLLLTAREVAEGPLGQRARTILVGSGKPGDGKTYCAVNLAISLAAERDVEILLVDADFAKPDVLKTLGVEESVGFLDVLADPTLDPETCIVRTDVPQLSLFPAGARTTSDTELLASRRTEDVIDRLLAANPKRMIVFDTPPTLAASPASVLALLVGQVMLVVRADRTTEADVREAVGLLDGCEHISLVLNAVSYEPGGGRFGSYYGQEKSS